jgi:pimeloyl-ACP methyl ester carboxylesterase
MPLERRSRLDVGCTTLRVPLDHADPGRAELDLAVVRVRHAAQHDRIGSIVLNPGGPGGSGLDSMPIWASWLPDELLTRFDLVTFDPRGVGSSAPIHCRDLPADQEAAPLPDLLSDKGFAAAKERLATQAKACLDVLGDTAGLYGTDATARDLDLLRAALGDQTLTYVGWSYGARLGAHYAHLFPGRVRALVLDAPPDPEQPWTTLVERSLTGFEDAFTSYAAGCGSRDSCAAVGDPEALLARVVGTARAAPIPSGRPAADPPATWDVVLSAVFGFLPASEQWPALDAALLEADRGDSGALYDMVDALEGKTPSRPDADVGDAAQAIRCTDTPPRPAADALRSDAARVAAAFPRFGEYGAWWLFACTYWTAPHRGLPVPTTATTAPLLVVGTRADPSTPYAGAQALTRALGPKAVLLTWDGSGHTAFGRSPCIGEHVVRYLLDVLPPATGTACP